MSSDPAVFVGLDCGGSTTRALAIDASGDSIFEGQSGSANLATTPPQVLIQNLANASKGCPPPRYVCGCFAGLLTENDRTRAKSYLAQVFPTSIVRAEPDFAAAYVSAETPIGVCVIAGTGSLICSRIEGKWIRSGGGGFLLGDAGSAFDVGRRALRCWLASEEGVTENLSAAIEETFRSLDPSVVVANLYSSPSPIAKLARLAPAFARDASAGEPVAYQALESAMGELCCEVVKHTSRHLPGDGTVRFGLAGGFWRASSVVQRVFDAQLRAALNRDYVLERIRRPPVRGAAALAMELTLGN